MVATPVTLAEFKAHLNRTTAAAADDTELTVHLESATEAIEVRVGPLVTREITEDVPTAAGRVLLTHRPVVGVSAVSTVHAGVVTPLSGFTAETVDIDAESGLVRIVALSAGRTGRITYEAGRGEIADVPARFKLAVLITAAHLWETQRGRGVTTGRWGTQEDEDLPTYMRGFALPRRALELIGYDEQVAFA
jgi:uncharacterized phiE125 gp8 family phage protein